jgi:hypothetical protein
MDFRSLFHRLYCYAQKHVRSIRAVTKTRHIESPKVDVRQNYLSPQRRFISKKKFINRNHPQLGAYNTSDRKAAVTVGVIMGTFLGKDVNNNVVIMCQILKVILIEFS